MAAPTTKENVKTGTEQTDVITTEVDGTKSGTCGLEENHTEASAVENALSTTVPEVHAKMPTDENMTTTEEHVASTEGNAEISNAADNSTATTENTTSIQLEQNKFEELITLFSQCSISTATPSATAVTSRDEENRETDGKLENAPPLKEEGDSEVKNGLTKGVEKLKEGLASESKGELRDALQLYREGLKYLLFCRKYVRKPEVFISALTHKCKEYLTRAEKIKEKLQHIQKTEQDEHQAAKDSTCENVNQQLPEFVTILSGDTPLTMEDVIGLAGVKSRLKEYVILPAKFPQLFSGVRRPHRGIMLYGPPGVGKTMLSRALAGELRDDNVTVLRVGTYDFTSKYLGNGEMLLKQLFCYANEHAPSIIIMDDFEALFPNSDEESSNSLRRLKTEWLIQFSITKATVICLTLSPWMIDPACRKRISLRHYVELPDTCARRQLFRHLLTPPQISGDTCPILTDDDYADFAAKTESYTGSDISVVARDAVFTPLREYRDAKYFRKVRPDDLETSEEKFVPCCRGVEGAMEKTIFDIPENELHIRRVSKEDILVAIGNSKPSTTEEELAKFAQFTEDFGFQ